MRDYGGATSGYGRIPLGSRRRMWQNVSLGGIFLMARPVNNQLIQNPISRLKFAIFVLEALDRLPDKWIRERGEE